ncbi:MAG: ABC transporter permease [Acidobacteria bacterium]|nr:ABC transporter permease [Acidobacteriota bacterium]
MRPYLAYLRTTLRLTARDRVVVFFNYLMPLIFFAAFGEGFGAKTSQGALTQVLSMVLMFGVLGSGFFGGGLRATIDREAGILRRFKVAPISPAPILLASIITGWVLFIPSLFLFAGLAKLRYGMEIPQNFLSLFIIVSAGACAFRAVGLIVAAVANSMAESQIIIQLLYLPMLMLSGATVPLSIMPDWLQAVAQFLPSTHLYLGMQGVLVRGESIAQNLDSLGAMLLTLGVGLFVSIKLFRWEKEEKIKPASKLWVLAVLAPFIASGSYQAWSKTNLTKTQTITRQMRRSNTILIRNARLFVGDGRVIEQGSLLVKNGKIAAIYDGPAPEAESLRAEAVEASGRTVLPALIDSGVMLMMPGTGAPPTEAGQLQKNMERELASYLYCGIGGVRTAPDPMGLSVLLGRKVVVGEIPGAEVLAAPPDPSTPSLIAAHTAGGEALLLKDALAQQVLEAPEMEAFAAMAAQAKRQPGGEAQAAEQVKSRMTSGERLAPVTRSGMPLLPHGPALHREMQLWVQAGVPAAEVLRAATFTAARAAGAAGRLGLLAPGYEATLIIVDGNPLEDISATTRLSFVMSKGEHVSRQDMLDKIREKQK